MHTLLKIIEKLRDKENGCPWDIEQTFESLSKHLIEEAYEATDAIARQDYLNLQEELGDVLLQVIFHSQIASEQELFNFHDVAETLKQKLIRRHPYVFNSGTVPDSAEEQIILWEAVKKEENRAKPLKATFADIPSSMPPILKAEKIQKQVSKKGFDWSNINDVMAKVEEEIDELKLGIKSNNQDNAQEELGDLLFSIINLSRHLALDASEAINLANNKFVNRVRLMEEEISKNKKEIEDLNSEELEELWVKIKLYESN